MKERRAGTYHNNGKKLKEKNGKRQTKRDNA
jgi:hypothetical protein